MVVTTKFDIGDIVVLKDKLQEGIEVKARVKGLEARVWPSISGALIHANCYFLDLKDYIFFQHEDNLQKEGE